MTQFSLIFTTRHRNAFAVERDCNIICECIVKFTPKFKCMYNGKGLFVFHVYDATKRARIGIMAELFDRINSLTYFKSIDLQSYTCK